MNAQEEDEIRRRCERLAVEFAHAVDHRDIDAVPAVFTDNAVFERKGERLVGRAAIMAAQRTRPTGVVTRHLCTTIKVDVVDADHARGVVYFLLFRHDGDEPPVGPVPMPTPATLGEYHDDYVRTAQGWRIARRVARAAFRRV
jgi:ketosteroid isomerase-like protein